MLHRVSKISEDYALRLRTYLRGGLCFIRKAKSSFVYTITGSVQLREIHFVFAEVNPCPAHFC